MEKIKIGNPNHQKRHRSNLVDKEEHENRKHACMNALLNRPWITKENDQQLYYWIKEKQSELKQWFMDFTGYSLFVNAKLAKLDKAPVVAYPWMGFHEFREPLDYALFTYALWFLESKLEQEQFLLTDIVKEIREYMSEQGMEVDWINYFHRLSMARALKKLKSMGIVQAVDGQESRWAQSGSEANNVLYECTSYSRYVFRNFPRNFTEYSEIEQLCETLDYGSEPGEQNQRRKHHLYRRYLLEPVVHDQVWQEDSFYFHSQRNNILAQIKTMFGWEGSRYCEGLLFFDTGLTPDSEVFPTLSAITDISILVCGAIRMETVNGESSIITERVGTVHLTKGEIERILNQLQSDYKKYWTSKYSKMRSSELAEEVCHHLVEWGFGEWGQEGIFVLYAVSGRWTAQYGTVELEI